MRCNFEAAVYYVSQYIQKVLQENYPGTSLGELALLRDIATSDFLHYLAQELGLYADEDFDQARINEVLCRYIDGNWHRVAGMIPEWLVLWVLKWRQRVKLVFNDDEFRKISKQSQSGARQEDVEEVLNSINFEALKHFVVSRLLAVGEYAALNAIAELMIRNVVSQLLEKHSKEEVIRMAEDGRLAAELSSRVYQLRSSSEPLLVLKVDAQHLI